MDSKRLEAIRKRIQELPPGGITYKTISGHRYAYYQWTENGKQHARRVKEGELASLSAAVRERKDLEEEERREEIGLDAWNEERNRYRSDQKGNSGGSAPGYWIAKGTPGMLRESTGVYGGGFRNGAVIRTGEELVNFCRPVAGWKRRDCWKVLHDYLYGSGSDKVLILYGLRRTGKTTLVRQAVLEMDAEMRNRTVFMQVVPGVKLFDINMQLHALEKMGFRNIFIDEVTLLDDFIQGAAVFSDIFASSGMKIVLSGTDSLGFMFSEDEQLFDRCIFIHTTFIPYHEFDHVLGIKGIDEYIRYGGTMSSGGFRYNRRGKGSIDEYVDSAIAGNIQHSLKNYQYGGHFGHLYELYERNELTSAVNRVVEDINHRFTLDVLTRNFQSHDLGISAANLQRDRSCPNDILYRIDVEKVTAGLKKILEIRDRNEQTVMITDAHSREIREYLRLLDLTTELDVVNIENPWNPVKRTVFTQPGLRYSQVSDLISVLMRDRMFSTLPYEDRKYVTGRIMSEVMGRMMEDIVLLETKLARPACQVFKLQFAVGEFDMVVFDPVKGCSVYEVKHSRERADEQFRHIIDPEKCRRTEYIFGPIRERGVIYRGESADRDVRYRSESGYNSGHSEDDGVCRIRYINVEEYLNGLPGIIEGGWNS